MKPIVAHASASLDERPMLNDRSSALSLLETRRSGRPRDMVGPGPSDDELEQILTIAMRAPDHGKLSPWRFVIVGKDQREAVRSPAPIAHLRQEDPERQPAALRQGGSSSRGRARRWSSCCRRPIRDHKIPVWEQELSAGAAAMNLLHRRPRAGLCRRLDHRLGGLFAEGERSLLRSRASGSPASSSRLAWSRTGGAAAARSR